MVKPHTAAYLQQSGKPVFSGGQHRGPRIRQSTASSKTHMMLKCLVQPPTENESSFSNLLPPRIRGWILAASARPWCPGLSLPRGGVGSGCWFLTNEVSVTRELIRSANGSGTLGNGSQQGGF